MLVIVDYKVGNLASIQNMLKKIGVQSLISSDSQQIADASKLILPGVGAFDYCAENLQQSNFLATLNHKVLVEKTPILGICVGMQLLGKGSEEGVLDGLGWIDGHVVRFKKEKFDNQTLKIPNMGFNDLNIHQNIPLFDGFDDEMRFYFVHGYHFVCQNPQNLVASVYYGYDYPAVVQSQNIIGAQFHPEKSHRFGMKLLKNFVEKY